MFFRPKHTKSLTFAERIENLRKAGLTVTPGVNGMVRAARDTYAIELREEKGTVAEARAGMVMGDEIGVLVDSGYQKFFRTPSGKSQPALANELKELHDFEEDVKEALGLESLYNQALGTTSTFYLYDRVKDRDLGVPKRAWE